MSLIPGYVVSVEGATSRAPHGGLRQIVEETFLQDCATLIYGLPFNWRYLWPG
jgi:hypothetical protein